MAHGAGIATANVTINEKAMEKAKARLRGAVARVHEHRGSVGLHEDQSGDQKLDYHGNRTKATLGEVAAYHEFFERSYLRTWFDTNKDRLGREMTEAMRKQYEGDKSAIDDLMLRFAGELQDWIAEKIGNLKPLTTDTVIEKYKARLPNPDVPLFATGQLVDAIRAHLDGYRL